jgi:predicted RNA binding protein YcfA (HicA-like mRNA interferase family)
LARAGPVTGVDRRPDSATVDASRLGQGGDVAEFYDRLVRILRAHGCRQVPGGKGSHEKWISPLNGRTVTVPRSKSRHTANEVLKQLGIDQRF